ncbi:MAG: mechanosensitive ion channel family protein [Candidatus Eremiobacteraeota bacterium]|nr:mechanosensitive ion channel family protein [Candidatus Eremiobacteraeota bacterium]
MLAQLTLPTAAPSPPGVQQDGAFLTAPIVLDGAQLFRIATPINAPSAQIPLALRQIDVQTALAELVAKADAGRSNETEYQATSLRVHIVRANGGDVAALEAVDAKHPDPFPIVTVTTADAKYNQLSLDSLATQWQTILQSALIRSLELRQPAVERRSLELVARGALGLAFGSILLWLLSAYFSRRSNAAAEEAAARERQAESQLDVPQKPDDAHRRRRRFLALALRSAEPAERMRFYRTLAELPIWTIVLAWFVAVAWAFGLFPQTTLLSDNLVHGTLQVVTTLVVAALVDRAFDIAIARVARIWERRPFVNSEDRARLLLRIPTIARALAGFKTFVLAFIAVLAILGEVGVPIGSVVTIGGLAAIALSLAAQNFVRDFVNGSLVLFEDQYVVGDYVTINTASGIVEYLSLRMVQIRDAAGDVVTIPHSSVTTVVNQSRNWSRVDYRVPVDPAADVPKALALVRAAIEELAGDPEWHAVVTVPIEWIGIDDLSRDWAIVRASVRTAPLRQFEFRRELNARVIAAFTAANIALGAQLPVTLT